MSVTVAPNLSGWATEDLLHSTLALHLACGRSKAVLKDKHRKQLCTLIQVLEAELDRRHVSRPRPPFTA